MADRSFLDWPFFEPRHRALADALEAWANTPLRGSTMPTPMRPAARW
jgi:acyl-CoA dehydrogenase